MYIQFIKDMELIWFNFNNMNMFFILKIVSNISKL
ncbi:hypothetical protein SDC9_181794 [bioreactor metagenome]|uniref:Uncharacterized protein n=1 Tax=bioreactor metagenome TaxID=1076179 RepID=A0A645H5J1_9ZZZZ